MSPLRAILPLAIAAAVACSRTDNLVSDDGGVTFADADPFAPDAGPNSGCSPEGPQCNNCDDDDDDGLIDGFDPECTGSLDDREDSFATGIPGDNRDAVKQDCFFDGDSGSGNDGCDLHVCCLLTGDCPVTSPPFDPAACEVSDECIANCAPLTPPGCDCFGCCTMCNDQGCFDVLINPATAPLCDSSVVDDPTKCPPCTPIDACDGSDCASPCADTADCLADEFCSAGCCIDAIG